MSSDTSDLPAILVTNDDGIDSPGIKSLVSVLGNDGFCRVYVCAPHEERSAVGHGITLRDTLEANLVTDYPGATRAYSLSGLPADCTSLGISGQMFPSVQPVLVVSGINKGGNSGLPVIYSGTVAGAREAYIAGVAAIAVSLDWSGSSTDELFEDAATVCLPLIKASVKAAVEGTFPKGFFLNVNVPVLPKENRGYKLTTQSLVNIGFRWDPIDRRTGVQVAAGRHTGMNLPMALPGMAGKKLGGGGSPIPLPGMSPVALPGMGRGGGLSLADLGAAAAGKAGGSASAKKGGEEEEHVRHRLHFRHQTLAWEKKELHPDQDIAALAAGYITVTPLALLTAAPSQEAVRADLSWFPSLSL